MTDLPEDLNDVDRRLQDARPEASPDAVARASQRARARVGTSAARPTRRLRLAIVAMLVAGFSLSGAGAGLAIDGIGGNQVTAGQDQYSTGDTTAQPTPAGTPAGGVLGNDDTGGDDDGTAGDDGSGCSKPMAGDASVAAARDAVTCPNDDGGATLGDDDSGDAAGDDGDQAGQQVEASTGTVGGTLPFTGWAALPVFALGIVLLASGVVLRRRTSDV